MTSFSATPSPSWAVPKPSANPSAPPQRFVCPITLDVFHDPVVAADGRTYERALILNHFEKHGCKSPITSEMLAHGDVVPNWLLREEMQECGYSLDKIMPAPRLAAAAMALPAADLFDARLPGRPNVLGIPVGGATPQTLPRAAPRALPRLASLPELRPLPVLGEEMVTLQVPMNTETGWVWTATGTDEDAATAALEALVQAGDAGREQALYHIATSAACPSVRVAATHAMGEVPSVAAVDLLRTLTATRDVGVAQAATFQLSSSTAQTLCQEAADSPTDINRCLRDLVCHVQDSDMQASSILFTLMLRASDYATDIAEHLTVVAATCHAKVALEAWEHFAALCQKDGRLHEHWLRNLAVLQGATHPDVANAAKRHMA